MKMTVKWVCLESSKDEGGSDQESEDMEKELFIGNPGKEKIPYLKYKQQMGGAVDQTELNKQLMLWKMELRNSPRAQHRKGKKKKEKLKIIKRWLLDMEESLGGSIQEKVPKREQRVEKTEEILGKFARILGQKAPTEHWAE